ncbi:MAG: hypothetical protein ACXVAT_12945, partial [Isosphaeraceae bacterium]
NADGTVLSDAVQDDRLALACEHQRAVPGSSRRITMDTALPLIVPCKIASQRTESQRIRTIIEEGRGRTLTLRDHVRTICVILSDFVGQFRRRSKRHG